MKGKYMPCDNCGKETFKTNKQLRVNKHFYCCHECEVEFRSKSSREMRPCEWCGKLMNVRIKEKTRFCSNACQNEWQRTRTGALNPKYRRKILKCECCGKEIFVNEYKLKESKHHFCSTVCRQKWFAEVWSQTQEWKDVSRDRAVKMLEDGKLPTTYTSIHKKINEELDKIGLGYICEHSCKQFSIDTYVPKYNLPIEIMGDFWHANPEKFHLINKASQVNRIKKDKIKRSVIEKYKEAKILYLWETDINKNLGLCIALIKQYIASNGKLENYNSFNYCFDSNGKLCLQKNLIKSYFELSDSELLKYVKIAG